MVVRRTAFSRRFNLGAVEKMLLEAAHDAYSIYDLLDPRNSKILFYNSERKRCTSLKKNHPLLQSREAKPHLIKEEPSSFAIRSKAAPH